MSSKQEILTLKEFSVIRDLVFQLSGIDLNYSNRSTVAVKLRKRCKQLRINTFSEYLQLLENSPEQEMTSLLDVISTNWTEFFRSPRHFVYLEETVLPQLFLHKKNTRTIRMWSAGCSSGEEAYSLAISIDSIIPLCYDWDIKILATDISREVLIKAVNGEYDCQKLSRLSGSQLFRYFKKIESTRENLYQVVPEIKKMIQFRLMNLFSDWPFQKKFDVIFCRNVMIYFNKHIQKMLIKRFYKYLGDGGYLFVGHSESLTGIQSKFIYQEPSVYRKAIARE